MMFYSFSTQGLRLGYFLKHSSSKSLIVKSSLLDNVSGSLLVRSLDQATKPIEMRNLPVIETPLFVELASTTRLDYFVG